MGHRQRAMAPHGTNPSKGEDCWVAIACKNDEQWRALCNLIGHPEKSNLALSERIEQHDEIDDMICAWSLIRTNQEATALLQDYTIAAGPVNNAADITEDQQVRARQFFVPFERFNTQIPGHSIQMGGIQRNTWTRCPDLGEHNREVLRAWLNYEDDVIRALERDAVIFSAPPT